MLLITLSVGNQATIATALKILRNADSYVTIEFYRRFSHLELYCIYYYKSFIAAHPCMKVVKIGIFNGYYYFGKEAVKFTIVLSIKPY